MQNYDKERCLCQSGTGISVIVKRILHGSEHFLLFIKQKEASYYCNTQPLFVVRDRRVCSIEQRICVKSILLENQAVIRE